MAQTEDELECDEQIVAEIIQEYGLGRAEAMGKVRWCVDKVYNITISVIEVKHYA